MARFTNLLRISVENHRCIEGRGCVEREKERVWLKLKGLDRIVSQVTHEIKLVVCGLGLNEPATDTL